MCFYRNESLNPKPLLISMADSESLGSSCLVLQAICPDSRRRIDSALALAIFLHALLNPKCLCRQKAVPQEAVRLPGGATHSSAITPDLPKL